VTRQVGTARMAAEYHNSCYQISTVHVKENLEVIEGEEDSTGTRRSWRQADAAEQVLKARIRVQAVELGINL
jgi:hypothetical protein